MVTKFTPFTFETAIPEEVGISSAAIAAFEARIRENKIGHQGYMLYRKGKLAACSIASPYRVTDKRHVYSISKSWTSTAIGIAVDEGLLSVEDSVISFFPDDLPETVSDNLAAMKVRHLLTMNTGHAFNTHIKIDVRKPNWAKQFLALPVDRVPGTHFMYNTIATYMLSAIITKLTGMRMIDYLRPRLFNPLGMEGIYCDECPDGISIGGYGVHVSPEDMLKLGILYLNKGIWNGKRILSEKWVEDASSAISDNSSGATIDWQVGYGYQFWRCQHNSFRGDGAFGQYIVVSPEKDAVMVIISETGSMQAVLDAYWDTIFASMSDEPLPIQLSGDMSAHPFMELPCGDADAPAATLELGENRLNIKKLVLIPAERTLMLRICGEENYASELLCGNGVWEYNHLRRCPIASNPDMNADAIGNPSDIAAAYAVKDGVTRIALVFVDSPHGYTIDYDGKTLIMTPTSTNIPQEVGIVSQK